jgi:hypothetical protein
LQATKTGITAKSYAAAAWQPLADVSMSLDNVSRSEKAKDHPGIKIVGLISRSL